MIFDLGDQFHKEPVPPGQEAMEQARARLFIDVMNEMSLTAAALGPLDFTPGTAGFREIAARMKYPMLAGNVIEDATGKPFFKETMIVESGGYRVGLWGVASPAFEHRGRTIPHEGFTIAPPAPFVKRAVEELRGKCDFIVGLANLTTDELEETAKSALGTAFILAGHNNKSFFRDVDDMSGIPVFQLPPRGKEVGVLTIVPSGKDFRFKNRSEVPIIQDRIRQYESVVSRMEKQAEGKKVEDHFSDSPADISRYTTMKEKLSEEQARLKEIQEAGSYFEFKTVMLGKDVQDDMQVNGWVTRFVDTHHPEPPSGH